MILKFHKFVLLAVLAGLPPWAGAQTITITNGVQKYGSLTSTTVTMSNRCELWVTSAVTPISSCTINMNSIDAWMFLPGIKPSVVASTYLSQLKVNGAAAVADGNCRVVQYGQNGALVIPEPSSFQPLTVFTGTEFTGTATSYNQWTYYTGAGVKNIRSFRLKRGYQVVFAQSSDGKNWGKSYVAQDGDLEIGVMPATLDQQVQFIYVTPWRWTSKKGIAGNPGNGWLNLLWWYDWNLDQSSSRDFEYLAIRQNQSWPSLSQNWQSLGINTVLGYNEPDQANQANMSISTAIGSWGDLLGTGLRVGSPATSDGAPNSWLIPFVQQADAGGLRVDFTVTHYYQANNPASASACATQMYNFLLNLWNNTHRPIWITEWNNGANWTDNNPYAAPTYAQQQACVQAMVNMLESTPFVERYSLYNWVEDQRSLVTSSNTVTLAGTVYSNTASALSYSQAMPDNGTRGIAEYLFTTNLWDASGYYNNAMSIGAPTYGSGHNSAAQAMVLDGTNSYLQLPANMAKGNAFTFAAWVYWNGGVAWQRIFDFGSVSTTQGGTPTQYMFLTPDSGSGTLRCAINSGSGEQIVERAGALTSGSWQHVAVTLNGSTAVLYVNGTQAASASVTITPSAFSPIKNYLGKSQFAGDPLFSGKLDGVEIADYAMTAAQVAVLYNGPQNPNFISGAWTNNASGNWGTGNNWNAGITANGASRVADFGSIDITANTTVTVDSARTIGGLKFGDLNGTQNWFLSGANTLTLDGGGGNTPLIAVNQNTATITAPLAGTNGLAKNGAGTLTLGGADNLGGSLTVNAGTVSISGGSTAFGSGTSSVGYLTGIGNLTMTGGSLNAGGEFRIGGSDQNGLQYIATGAVTVANATLSVGTLTVARANYLNNTISGTLTVNGGGTVVSTNDVIVEFAGMGRGRIALNGGNVVIGPAATKWLMVGYYDTGGGELDITNGNLLLENGSSIKMCRSGNTGTNLVNQVGGTVTFYSDAGVTPGGGGNLDLDYAGSATSSSVYNLKGGILIAPQVTASSSTGGSLFNFNGGTLKPAASSATFFQGLTTAAIMIGGAKIDTTNCNISIAQPLVSGDNFNGHFTKLGSGTLTLTAANTYTGGTTVSAGMLLVNGSMGSGAVTVAGGTLGGNGVIGGLVAVQPGGTLAPGGGLTTLTVNNSVTLQAGSTTTLEISKTALTNDQLHASGTLTCAGTLIVTNLGGTLALGDAFQLFQAGSISGSFSAYVLPALDPSLGWNTANLSSGVISVISAVPTNLVWSVSGPAITLSWPADHTGWRLQVQTNSLSVGLGTNWVDVSGATQTNSENLPVDSTQGSIFYRLIYP